MNNEKKNLFRLHRNTATRFPGTVWNTLQRKTRKVFHISGLHCGLLEQFPISHYYYYYGQYRDVDDIHKANQCRSFVLSVYRAYVVEYYYSRSNHSNAYLFIYFCLLLLFLYRFSQPLRTFAAIVAILIMVTGLIGNLLTIIALCKYPKVRNVAAAFIIRWDSHYRWKKKPGSKIDWLVLKWNGRKKDVENCINVSVSLRRGLLCGIKYHRKNVSSERRVIELVEPFFHPSGNKPRKSKLNSVSEVKLNFYFLA